MAKPSNRLSRKSGKPRAKRKPRSNQEAGSTTWKLEKMPELPDPGSDKFAYLVAALAWRDGLTANAIAKELKLPPKPLYLMQVKRALKRAHNRFLKLEPLEDEKLSDELTT